MSTTLRARLAATAASAGVLMTGWSVATANGQLVPPGSGSASTASGSSGTSTASGSGRASTSAGSGRTSTSAGSSSGTGTSGSATTGTSASTTTLKDGTWTGTTASHRFGTVTVTATVANGVITQLSERVVSDGDHHSDQINSRSVPTLKSRILAANSANVSTISGATYTTRAYLSSLQSALDKAR